MMLASERRHARTTNEWKPKPNDREMCADGKRSARRARVASSSVRPRVDVASSLCAYQQNLMNINRVAATPSSLCILCAACVRVHRKICLTHAHTYSLHARYHTHTAPPPSFTTARVVEGISFFRRITTTKRHALQPCGCKLIHGRAARLYTHTQYSHVFPYTHTHTDIDRKAGAQIERAPSSKA